MSARIELDLNLCNGDGICVEYCPYELFHLKETADGLKAEVISTQDCTICNTCVGLCPNGAITVSPWGG